MRTSAGGSAPRIWMSPPSSVSTQAKRGSERTARRLSMRARIADGAPAAASALSRACVAVPPLTTRIDRTTRGIVAPMQIDARLRLFLYIVGVFLTCLLIGNLIGGKLTGIWIFGEERLISVGQLSFPLTFVLTDIVNEFYGRRAARTITMLGFFMTVLAFGVIHLAD